MTNPEDLGRVDGAAYRQGWRAGLALGALAIAVVAFINLLSVEKSILAIVLAVIAMSGAGPGRARTRGWLTLVIAAVHIVVFALFLVFFHDRLVRLLSLLQSLG